MSLPLPQSIRQVGGRNGISALQIGEEGENDFVITQFRLPGESEGGTDRDRGSNNEGGRGGRVPKMEHGARFEAD